MAKRVCLIALGANAPAAACGRRANLRAALRRLTARGVHVRARSRWFENPAEPPGSGPPFTNGVALAETALRPLATLRALQQVEASLGRTRVGRAGHRTADLDLLAHGSRMIPPRAAWLRRARFAALSRPSRALLVLPHPCLHTRAFALVPLLEVAPRWIHPALGARGEVLRRRLPPSSLTALAPSCSK